MVSAPSGWAGSSSDSAGEVAEEGPVRYCTIVARNYLAHARVLAESVRRHTGERLAVLFVDGPIAGLGPDEAFDALEPADLPIEQAEFRRMAAIYEITELSTALKPSLLDALLLAGADAACYLDPDIRCYREMPEIAELLTSHDVVLTPHLTEPIERDGLLPDEDSILFAGAYNLGFVAVSARARPLLRWWADRLRRECVTDHRAARFVDQRWMDLAPGLAPTAVLRDRGFNVAYWNLHARPIRRVGREFEAGGRPLRFFHFSGFSPFWPYRLSGRWRGPSRVDLTAEPALARLLQDYADDLFAAGFVDAVGVPYRLEFTAAGDPIDLRMRRLHRAALLEAERDGGDATVPDPFDPEQVGDYRAWMFEQSDAPGPGRVGRYYRLAREEMAARGVACPDPEGVGSAAFLEWCSIHGGEVEIPRPYLPPFAVRERPSPTAVDEGVNVVGYLRAEAGVGEVARLLLEALRVGGVPHSTVSFDATPSRDAASFSPGSRGPYDVTIACVNADQLPFLEPALGGRLPAARSTVGIWAWEVERFPDWMARSASLIDEIWCYSRHAADAISAAVDVPVRVVPPTIPLREPPTAGRRELGLPEGFLFCFCFDFFSVFDRKNPLAVIDAFTRAFAPGEGPQLVVKGVNAHLHPIDAARLRARVERRPDVHLRFGYETPERQLALIASADAYVSLHRAEGYGLTMAEAMSLGKPVIATGYSGNLEFMDESNSLLVPWDPVAIPLGRAPYPAGARWAEPRVDAAAAMMRKLVTDSGFARDLGARARTHVRREHSPERTAEIVKTHLAQIRGGDR